MTREEKIKGLYSLKEYLVENPIELEGYTSLPITLIDYAIEALEQEPCYENYLKKSGVVISQLRANRDRLQDAFDNIRAEIAELTKCSYGTECLGANCPSNTDCMICGDHVLEIIDKYKAEIEPQEKRR